MWSAAVNLFEVITLIAVALFLLVGVVVAALRPAPLLGLLFGRLRPSARLSALPARVALWAEVRATWRHVTAATPPALSLGLGLGLGLLRRSGFGCSVTLFMKKEGGEIEGIKVSRGLTVKYGASGEATQSTVRRRDERGLETRLSR